MDERRSLLGRPLPPRVAIVAAELARFERPRYLELGVNVGVVFLRVRARRKVGVDPASRIPGWKRVLHPNTLLRGSLVKATSDAYFASLAPDIRFDVVFVDGDHSHETSLRDIKNALSHLRDDGVVLVHDCNPPNGAAAGPDPAAASGGPWCGEVWRTIVSLRATRTDLDVEVLDTDFGVATVRRDGSGTALDLGAQEVAALTYDDLAANRSELLGLRAI